MSRKKLIILPSVLLFCLILFYLWNNILILDDHHPQKEYIDETSLTYEDDTSPQGQSGQTADNGQSSSQMQVRKGYHIFINLDEVKMYVYNNGELIKVYPVSGGKPSTPSPLGTWRIIGKDTWGEGFGGAWMAFNVPWGKYGIHGTIYPWFIGRSNSSKGCIRMKNKDVKELYKIVPHGTTVTIEHKNRVFRTLKSGDIGSDVLEVQKALKKLNYYPGYPDGKFGNGLKNGVKKFQKDYRLWTSGSVNKQTYDLILLMHNQKLQQEQQEQKEQEQQIQQTPQPTQTPPAS